MPECGCAPAIFSGRNENGEKTVCHGLALWSGALYGTFAGSRGSGLRCRERGTFVRGSYSGDRTCLSLCMLIVLYAGDLYPVWQGPGKQTGLVLVPGRAVPVPVGMSGLSIWKQVCDSGAGRGICGAKRRFCRGCRGFVSGGPSADGSSVFLLPERLPENAVSAAGPLLLFQNLSWIACGSAFVAGDFCHAVRAGSGWKAVRGTGKPASSCGFAARRAGGGSFPGYGSGTGGENDDRANGNAGAGGACSPETAAFPIGIIIPLSVPVLFPEYAAAYGE